MEFVGPRMLSSGVATLADSLSIFRPASPNTHAILDLAILTLAITGLIFLVVEGVLFYSVWRFRHQKHAAAAGGEPPQVYGSMPIEVAWTAAPAMIVFFLVLVTTRTLWDVEPTLPQPAAGDNTLFVTVIGHQWWFEYVYETYNGRRLGFVTANELHVPASDSSTTRPAYLVLKSADVCHSFWVPRLSGKVDLIPGHTNLIELQTQEAGLHLGQCAEFCGAQHANMLIRVYVDPPAEFEKWLDHQLQPARDDPAVRAGKEAFLAESCVNCHRIRGTTAGGSYAPDLTHFMSRETFAGCMIETTPENLHRWVRDPQTVKPGCLMPAFGLDGRQLDLVVQYISTLE